MQLIQSILEQVKTGSGFFDNYYGLARKNHLGHVVIPVPGKNEYKWAGITDDQSNYFYCRFRDGSRVRYEQAESSKIFSGCEEVVKSIYELRIVAVVRSLLSEDVEKAISSELLKIKFVPCKDLRLTRIFLKGSDTDSISVFIDEHDKQDDFDPDLILVSVDFDVEVTHAQSCCVIDLNSMPVFGTYCNLENFSIEELNNGLTQVQKNGINGTIVTNCGQVNSEIEGDAGDINSQRDNTFFTLIGGGDRFEVVEPGAFIDHQTALFWDFRDMNGVSFDGSISNANNSSFGTFTDWYSPNYHEITTLYNVDEGFNYSPLNTSPTFPAGNFEIWLSNGAGANAWFISSEGTKDKDLKAALKVGVKVRKLK